MGIHETFFSELESSVKSVVMSQRMV